MFLYPIVFISIVVGFVLLALYSKHQNRLFNAVARGDIATIERMLGQGPQIASRSDTLLWAARFNQQAVCDLFLRHGYDLKANAASALNSAILHPGLLKFLIERGADVNAASKDTISPLQHAATTGCLESARILIDHGADLDASSEYWHFTPLLCAARRGHVEMVDLLLASGADARWVELGEGLTPFKGPPVDPDRLTACEQRIRQAQNGMVGR